MGVDVQVLSPTPSRKVMSIRSVAWLQSLRGRLMLVLFAVGVIPIVIVGAIAHGEQQSTRQRALTGTADHVGQALDRYLYERYGDVQVQALTLAGISDRAAQASHLEQVVQLYRPAYSLIVLTDTAGKIVATNDTAATERLRGYDLSANEWFRTALSGRVKKPLVEDPHKDLVLRALYGEGTQSEAMTFTMPVERNGEVTGVLRTFASWPAIQELAGAQTQLRNSEGKTIHGADAGEDEVTGGAVKMRGSSDYAGPGWSVVSRAPADAGGMLRLSSVVVALLVALVVFPVAFFLARYLTGPLDMMVGTLHNLASIEADLSQRLPSNRADEIGIVSRSFNTFVSNMERMIDQVIRAGMQVTMSSTQIAAGSHQLEATMSEQVAATNEVVATTNEIAATANDLASTMSAVAQMSEETAEAASRGQRDLHQMADAVTRMEEATQAVSARLSVINEKAGNIASVVTTITKVADQTNLLSLNAAIEAEKAGQFGQGFAVVAREIRRLADQTAVATLDIEKMVREMKSAVSSGVMSMEKLNEQVHHSVDAVRQVGAQLETIVEKVQEVTPRFESAHVGMQAQLQGAQQISIAMGQLSESTQQTAGALRDSNRAIGELNHAASSLQGLFSRFKLTAA